MWEGCPALGEPGVPWWGCGQAINHPSLESLRTQCADRTTSGHWDLSDSISSDRVYLTTCINRDGRHWPKRDSERLSRSSISMPFLSGAAEPDPSVRALPWCPQNCPPWVHVVGSTVATGGNGGPGDKNLPKPRPQPRPSQIYL